MAFPTNASRLISQLRSAYLASNSDSVIGEHSMKPFSFRDRWDKEDNEDGSKKEDGGIVGDKKYSESPPIEYDIKKKLEDLKIGRDTEFNTGFSTQGVKKPETKGSRRANSSDGRQTGMSAHHKAFEQVNSLKSCSDKGVEAEASKEFSLSSGISDNVSQISNEEEEEEEEEERRGSGSANFTTGNVHYQVPDRTYENQNTIENGNSASSASFSLREGNQPSVPLDKEVVSEDFEDEISSSDSAFTYIETDSILNSSIISPSYDDSFLYENSNDESQSYKSGSRRSKKKKSKTSLQDTDSISKSGSKLHKSPSQFLSKVTYNTVPTGTDIASHPVSLKIKSTLTFAKLELPEKRAPENLTSNLSLMIHTKFKSWSNPLDYFAFASGESEIGASEFKIFVPPSQEPLIESLRISSKVDIFSCIGYILLELCNESLLDDSDVTNLNPNLWRMELVDEDGENYGSFGILDRTRYLSSYNNPKEIAVCRIRDAKEISRNEMQSPLPQAFKQSLMNSEIKDLKSSSGDYSNMVTLQIINKFDKTPNKKNEPLQLDAPLDMSIENLMRIIGNDYNIDPKLISLYGVLKPTESKEGISRVKSSEGTYSHNTTISSRSTLVLLKPDQHISDLEKYALELCKAYSHSSLLASNKFEHPPDSFGITPEIDSVSVSTITPANKEFSGIKESKTMKQRSVSNPNPKTDGPLKGNKVQMKNLKREIASNRYLEDMMKGRNPSLPVNVNTVYYRWKVWRKKATLLNRIEKQLILDGDYVHLTPDESSSWKKNPIDSMFSQSQSNQSGHHNYLHHYNYTNYYVSSLMKTSSFHITQIIKLKQYVHSKNPNHFKIVIYKPTENSNGKETVKKKYDLEAINAKECEEIISKLKWARQVYHATNANSNNN